MYLIHKLFVTHVLYFVQKHSLKMSGLRTPIFLRVPKYNSDAHENVEAEFDVSQKQQYIEQEKYAMSIQRVVVPTSKIKHVHIEDNYDQYFVAVKPDGSQEAVDGADNSGVPSSYIPTDFLSFGQLLDDRVGQTTWLSNTQTLGVDGVELDNYVNMEAYFNQSAQFIYENINRAIVRAYLGGLWNITWNQHVDLPVAYYPRSHYKQMDVIIRHDRTHNWIAYDQDFSQIEAGRTPIGTFNFMPASQDEYDRVANWGNVCGVILNMKSMPYKVTVGVGNQSGSPPDDVTFGMTFMPGRMTNIRVHYVLEGPPYTDPNTGETVRQQVKVSPPINGTNAWFSDGAITNVSHIPDNKIDNQHVQPVESFQAFSETPFASSYQATPNNTNAKWTLYMEFGDTIQNWIGHWMNQWKTYGLNDQSYAVAIIAPRRAFEGYMYCFSNYGVLPTIPPVIGTNEEGKLTVVAQNAWFTGRCDLMFSSRLKDLLNLGNGYLKNVNITGQDDATNRLLYKLYAPFSPGMPITTMTEIKTMAMQAVHQNHTNIRGIDIVSVGIDVNNELQADETPNDVLMSLVVDPDALNKPLLVFTYDSAKTPMKRFYFEKSGPLNSFKLRMYVSYKNGHREMLRIGPDEYAEIYLIFEPLFRR